MGTRYDHAGGAVSTTLNADITSGATSAVIVDATGWPSGGAAGEFWIAIGTIDPTSQQFTSNVEKIKVGSRTGTTLSTLTRGADGTTATAHVAGETVRHIFASDEAHQASEHAGDTTRDDHTQYNTAARHAATSHTQAMMAADSIGAAQIIANAVGASELADDAVDTAAIVDLAVTTAKLNDLAVTTAKIALANVTTATIADSNVTTAKIADANVTTAKFAAGAVTNGSTIATGQKLSYASAADPGAVGDGSLWFDTNNRQLKARNAADTGWELIGMVMEDWTSFTPTLTGITIGNGSVYGDYMKIGKLVVGVLGVRWGTTTTTDGSDFAFTLPYDADFNAAMNTANGEWLGGGRGSDASSSGRWASIGRITSALPGTVVQFATAGTLGWDSTTPFTWANTDLFSAFFMYRSTT